MREDEELLARGGNADLISRSVISGMRSKDFLSLLGSVPSIPYLVC